MITVSHDRYFLDNVADRILELDGNGHVSQYEGGYTDYLRAKKSAADRAVRTAYRRGELPKTEKTVQETDTSSDSLKTWKQPSRKLKFTYKEQREYETIDDDIAVLEEKLESIERQIEANATNSVKLRELMAEQEKTQALLDEKTERWVYLNDLAEKSRGNKPRDHDSLRIKVLTKKTAVVNILKRKTERNLFLRTGRSNIE